MASSYSSLSLYYKEVGEYPLLTAEQEQKLGANGSKKTPEDVSTLVRSNLRLVAKIAQDFQGRGLDIEDLISEGNMGLHTGAKKYDANKGAKFSYYASFWIRQNILRAISNHSRLIRIPVCTLDKCFKIINFINKHKKENGETPSHSQLAKRFKVTKKRVAEILEAAEAIVPLDAKVGSEGDTKIHDVISDDIHRSPDESLFKRDDYKMLGHLVSKLPKREGIVIRRRFNLDGEGKQTLEALGKKLNLTRERVRQIETLALDRLNKMAKGKLCV
jgi:RNA polymerase primary sigma factor